MNSQIVITVHVLKFLVFFLAGVATSAHANEAQYHICGVGLNLGQAASREFFFGREMGGAPPPDQVASIATNVSNAAAHASTAETQFTSPMPPDRPPNNALDGFLRNLENYMSRRTSMNYSQRASYLGSLAGNYRDAIGFTFASNRLPAIEQQTNCDTKIFDACYQFGYASTAAAVGDGVGQQSSLGAMRTAIYSGLRLAGDLAPISEIDEVCCAMGSRDDWEPILGLTKSSPHSAFVAGTPLIMQIAASARLAPGACGAHSGSGEIVGLWRGCNGRMVRFVKEGSEYVGYYTAIGDLGRFGFRQNEASHRVTRTGPGRYTGHVKWRWTNGDMKWQDTVITVDGDKLTDSGGDQCARTMTRQ